MRNVCQARQHFNSKPQKRNGNKFHEAHFAFKDQSKYRETDRVEEALPQLCHLYVHILSQETAKGMGLPMTALGAAPRIHSPAHCYILHHEFNKRFGNLEDVNREYCCCPDLSHLC